MAPVAAAWQDRSPRSRSPADAISDMLSTGETYRDLGPDCFTNRDPERQTTRLVKQLERLGRHVTLTAEAAAA